MDEWYNLNRIEVFAESDSLLAMTEINQVVLTSNRIGKLVRLNVPLQHLTEIIYIHARLPGPARLRFLHQIFFAFEFLTFDQVLSHLVKLGFALFVQLVVVVFVGIC